VKTRIGFAGLVVLLLIAFGSSSLAFSPNVAVGGNLSYANRNPAGLMGLETPEFGLKLRMVSQENDEELEEGEASPYSREYQVLYAEPDYGTGAGLLHFIYSDTLRQITYSVADQLMGYVDVGIALSYMNHPASEAKYVSTDLGFQIGDFSLIQVGILIENFWHLKIGETEAALPTNIVLGTAVDLGNFGIVSLDVNDVLNTNSSRKFMAGLEIQPMRFLSVRASWNEGLSVGAGLDYGQLSIDYDWACGQHLMGFSWKF